MNYLAIKLKLCKIKIPKPIIRIIAKLANEEFNHGYELVSTNNTLHIIKEALQINNFKLAKKAIIKSATAPEEIMEFICQRWPLSVNKKIYKFLKKTYKDFEFYYDGFFYSKEVMYYFYKKNSFTNSHEVFAYLTETENMPRLIKFMKNKTYNELSNFSPTQFTLACENENYLMVVLFLQSDNDYWEDGFSYLVNVGSKDIVEYIKFKKIDHK